MENWRATLAFSYFNSTAFGWNGLEEKRNKLWIHKSDKLFIVKWSFKTCNALGELSQVYKTLWRNYRYIKRSHIFIMKKKLPLVIETSESLPTAKLTTQQLCSFNRTHIQHQNLASSNFWHLWNTALWIRPSNFIFLSCTKPTEKLHSFPTETELF